MNTYRIWNASNGTCVDSYAKGFEPAEAFDRATAEAPEAPDLYPAGKYIIARIDAGCSNNAHQFAVVERAPVVPAYENRQVTL